MRGMFDQAKAEQIISEIAAGESMVATCRKLGVDRSVVYDCLRDDPHFADKYARAAERRADSKADEIDDIAEAVRTGQLAPDAGRVVIDAKKWIASKLRPKVYGDRITQDVDLTMRVTIEDPTLRATATLVQQPTLPNPSDE